jgi:hypothetical protein
VKTYFFRLVKYPSQRVRCYYLDDSGNWKVTGVDVPLALRNRGLTVEFEEMTEKEHKADIKAGKK